MQMKKYPEVAALIVRMVLGFIFFMHGMMKFQGGLAGTAGFFEKLGIPGFMAYAVASIELFGGILLILGLGSRLIPVLFAGIMIVAMMKVPSDKGFFASNELHLTLLTMSAYIALNGSPLLSLDNLLFARKNHATRQGA